MNKSMLTIGLGLLIVLLVASVTVLDTKVYEKKSMRADERKVEKIESDQGVAQLESFHEKPESVSFDGGDFLEIIGEHEKYGYGTYRVDLKALTVEQILAQEVKDPSKYKSLFRNEYGIILISKDKSPGLYHQTNEGTLNKISGNFVPATQADVQVSQSGDKLIYMVKESQQMATYSLESYRKKVIPGDLPASVFENFHESIRLSPDGGYFTVISADGSYPDHSINVFGADSGRKYAEEIKGTAPVWSPDGKRLAFVYTGQLESPTQISNTRIGYIKFPEREIVYFDKLPKGQTLDENFYWSADGSRLSYIERSGEGKLELRTYNVDNGGLYSFDLDIETQAFPSNVYVNDKAFVLYWNEEKVLKLYDDNGVALSDRERIDTIESFDGFDSPFVVSGQSVLYYKDNQLFIQDGVDRKVLEIQGLEHVDGNENLTYLVTGIVNESDYKLAIISNN